MFRPSTNSDSWIDKVLPRPVTGEMVSMTSVSELVQSKTSVAGDVKTLPRGDQTLTDGGQVVSM